MTGENIFVAPYFPYMAVKMGKGISILEMTGHCKDKQIVPKGPNTCVVHLGLVQVIFTMGFVSLTFF